MTMSSTDAERAMQLFEFAPGKRASWAALGRILPDVATALFFAKAMKMDYQRLSELLFGLFRSSVVVALSEGNHSTSLQDYVVETVPPYVWPEGKAPDFNPTVPPSEVLPELWEAATIQVASSIAEVAEKLAGVLHALPSKEGEMAFAHLAKLNRQRPTIGVYQARIQHRVVPDSLVVLDVSGSMTEETIRKIVGDVVALSWKANAHLAIVSDSTFLWEPGSFDAKAVLRRAEFGGTHYETLAPLLNRDWGTVVSIADYDSSASAKRFLSSSSGRIGKVLDISLVNRPTFLGECLAQLADEVEPLLVATGYYPISY